MISFRYKNIALKEYSEEDAAFSQRQNLDSNLIRKRQLLSILIYYTYIIQKGLNSRCFMALNQKN